MLKGMPLLPVPMGIGYDVQNMLVRFIFHIIPLNKIVIWLSFFQLYSDKPRPVDIHALTGDVHIHRRRHITDNQFAGFR